MIDPVTGAFTRTRPADDVVLGLIHTGTAGPVSPAATVAPGTFGTSLLEDGSEDLGITREVLAA